MHHTPVLHNEVIKLLNPQKGETVLDSTLGLGGHAESFLEAIGESGKLIGIEADKENLKAAQEKLKPFAKQIDLRHANFGDIAALNLPKVDILFADLGLSSPHVDDTGRGFTFRENAPLDMRFDRTKGITAAGLIKSLSEEDLADILWRYGELRSSRRIAREIQEKESVDTTFDIKECVEKAVGYKSKGMLPQVFQALRIAVNDELNVLNVLLQEGVMLLKSGGRMGVISYHSLEDRMVKQAFRSFAEPKIDKVTGQIIEEADFEVFTKKPVIPSDEEVAKNPRARSAKLRIIERMNNEK